MMKVKTFLRKKHGFSMVELVVVILIIAILAAAIFVGGGVSIAHARESQATSDLHSYDVALKSYALENTDMLRLNDPTSKTEYAALTAGINEYLPSGYKILENEAPATSGNGIIASDATDIVFKTEKLDPWGNPYHLILSGVPRNQGEAEFYITVASAGNNGQTDLSNAVDDDDLFLLLQYTNGAVTSQTYNMATDTNDTTSSTLKPGVTTLTPDSSEDESPRNNGIPRDDTTSDPITGGSSGSDSGSGSIFGPGTGGNLGGEGAGHTHLYTSVTSTTPATCQATGTRTVKCACGATIEEVLPKGDHTYGDWVVTTEPTVTSEGLNTRTCTVCGATETETVAKLPPVEYDMLDGAGQTATTDNIAAFRSEAEIDKFEYVKVDGTVVSPDNYTVTEGSTIVTLKTSYMATLAVGSHTIDVVSSDGIASCEFEVTEPAVVLITFTIDGVAYQAEEGMNWIDWCKSDYNTDGYMYSINESMPYVMSPRGAFIYNAYTSGRIVQTGTISLKCVYTTSPDFGSSD